MHEVTDDRSTEERLIATALAAGPASGSNLLDGSRVLARARERIAARGPEKPRRWMLPIGGRVVSLAIVVALAAAVPIASTFLSSPGHHVRIVSMSWPYAYGSIREIGAASDVVVVGTVAGVIREDHAARLDLPQTVFSVTVERTLKGDPGQGDLPVLQDGGREAVDTWAEAEDFPLMAVGDHVLLFLRRVIQGEGIVWLITGGPQGRLLVSEGQVTTTATSLVLPIPTSLTVDQVDAALVASP